MSQGRNPWSDLGSREALQLAGAHLVRATRDASDDEARECMMWAATLAGIAFGNAGVHIPHAMAYAVAGLARDFQLEGYPAGEPLVPHGVSVIVNAPAVFQWTSSVSPALHKTAAACLGADTRDCADADAGALLAERVTQLLRDTGLPTGLEPLGYTERDIDQLVRGTAVQRRLLDNAPRAVHEPELDALFRAALRT